ncbi:YdcH family protein [Thiohalobacter sp. IOR34]|uniref:YdcH family protein n=1 Tax=Thiohalobacter sp. IOR34 TaxID=3057176 RepID=UPI0025AF2573|nr:YdcH family protein [Thiohalobacter sp. IOR34]WJW76107.1 YdcH family protein [Thiohalobacter sp. IOR34]
MQDSEATAIRQRLEQLRLEHQDLDQAITRLALDPQMDQLALNRMKKRKLLLKDMISRLESRLIPDLDA